MNAMKTMNRIRTLLCGGFGRLLLLAACAAASSACDAWTEPEGVGVAKPEAGQGDPKLYAEYLAALRAYRHSAHKIVYAEFANDTEKPVSRAHHPASLPDSVDIVCLSHPDVMPAWMAGELAAMRRDKGIRTVYAVDYEAVEAEYQTLAPDEEFAAFAEERIDALLALCDAHDYDGVTLRYHGRSTLAMTDAERAEFAARQRALLDKAAAWRAEHPDKLFIFEGHPEYLLERDLLREADYLVMDTRAATDVLQLTLQTLASLRSHVPTDRVLVTVSTVSLDPSDTKTGYFSAADGSPLPALREAACWVATDDAAFVKAGLVVASVAADYHDAARSYARVREAVSIMNPTPKYE